MGQPPRLKEVCVAQCQCLVRKAEAEKDIPKISLGKYVRVDAGVMGKLALRVGIISPKRLLQMRSRRSKYAGEHQVYTRRQVTQNEAGRVVPLAAQTQQIRVQALG